MDQKIKEKFQNQIEKNSMKSYLNRLQNNDAIFDEIRYPTGFSELDKALAGGLGTGLHCIGAISSLGKTTFVLQMAENIASNGTPVILFSLEMRPEQLVAKTVSKNMYLAALEQADSQKIDIYHHAKGYSELMNKRNRCAFTKQEQGIYKDSIKKSSSDMMIISETEDGRPFWFARHGRALMGESPKHTQVTGSA